MSCIPKLLALKGDKEFLKVSPGTLIECGGEYRGYDYLITFRNLGFRCAYVAIPKGHPLFMRESYDDLTELDVHGGVTFFSEAMFDDVVPHECGDKWIGFDAGHCTDIKDMDSADRYFSDSLAVNFLKKYTEEMGVISYLAATVKTTKYMEHQCKSLIDQIIEHSHGA
jgi:hypothetical protein